VDTFFSRLSPLTNVSARVYCALTTRSGTALRRVDEIVKRVFDVTVGALLLVLLLPLFCAVAIAIKLESRGPVFYRSRRVGYGGREFKMLKFRKMREDVAGLPLTLSDDGRFTSVGQILARFKIDELPQFWNVVKGDMSLVGPRPEDPRLVSLASDAYGKIVDVRPGITGLSQLAFVSEGAILDSTDPLNHYLQRLFPQKIQLDQFYRDRRSLRLDLYILVWTLVAVLLRHDVSVHRHTGRLARRRRASSRQSSLTPQVASDEDAASMQRLLRDRAAATKAFRKVT